MAEFIYITLLFDFYFCDNIENRTEKWLQFYHIKIQKNFIPVQLLLSYICISYIGYHGVNVILLFFFFFCLLNIA